MAGPNSPISKAPTLPIPIGSMGLVDVIFSRNGRTWNPQRLLAWHSRGGESTFGLQSQVGGPKFPAGFGGNSVLEVWKRHL